MQLNRVDKADNLVKIRNVLISTAEKTGLEYLVRELLIINPDIRFYSTGGTYKAIKDITGDEEGGNLISVSDYTGQPEMQGGLVKTLDFKIYMGLLSETYNGFHQADLKKTGALEFDLVIVNLYPFSDTISRPGTTLEDARANIDIGGPCMLRAAAKNYLRAAVVCSPGDYKFLVKELNENKGASSFDFRFDLAKKAFSRTAEYDAAIASYLKKIDSSGAGEIYKLL